MVETENVTKQKKKFINGLKSRLQVIIIILLSAVYVSQGLFAVQKKETTIWDILGNIGLSIAVGVIISGNLRSMGLKDGRLSDAFVSSMQAYGNAKAKATPNFDKLMPWCDYKNSLELEARKREIIQSRGLNWKAYKYGYYEEHQDKLSKEQIEALEKAKNCRLDRITADALLSDLPHIKHRKGGRFGITQQEYVTREATIDTVSRVAIGIILGLYGLSPLLTKENAAEIVANMIWNFFQIMLWLAFGIMKYADAKAFIEDDYRQTHIIQKTELLNEFIITMDKNPDVVTSCDTDIETNIYIEEFLAMKNKINTPVEEVKEEKNEEEGVSNQD